MLESIFITYTNATAIPYQGKTLAHHAVLNYIDSEGNHYTLEGVPERKFNRNAEKLWAAVREEALSSGSNNTDSSFQRLQAKTRKPNRSAAEPRTMVAEGNDLSAAWKKMVRFGDEVNSTGYEYRPISQNSNSFAAAALKRAGFFGPGTAFPEFFDHLVSVDSVNGETRPVFVPGFDQRLTNPLSRPVTVRTPLNGSEVPLVPTIGNSEHGGRQNLLNGRFGIWVAPPSGRPNQPAPSLETGRPAVAGDKPVRYLSRRITGNPEASAFDTGAPSVPFVPTNGLISPEADVSFGDRFGGRASSAYGRGSASHAFPQSTSSGLAGRIGALAGIDPAEPVGTPQTSDGAISREVNANRRFLTRRTVDQPSASVFDAGALAVPFVPTNDFLSPDTKISFGDRFGGRASSGFNDGLGRRASDPFSPDTLGGLAGRLAALAGIDPANPDPRVLTPPENGFYNDELSQSWLFRALTGRLR